MNSYINILIFCVLFYLIQGCNSDEEISSSGIKTTVLEDYKTLGSIEEDIIGTPDIIKYGGESNLFVYDGSRNQILKLNRNGEIVSEIGRTGRGPGEYLLVNNMFLVEQHLYIIDEVQLLAYKYDLEGTLVSSLDFGKIAGGRPAFPPPPTGAVIAKEIDNKPYITLQGNIMLSNTRPGSETNYLYKVIDWKDQAQIGEMGEVPTGSSYILDNKKLRNQATNGVIPSFIRHNSFPVQDRANPEEFFIIYSTLAKISKYSMNGKKLWENKIKTEEIDSIRTRYFEGMDEIAKSSPIRHRIELEFFISGISNDMGNLFLVVNTYPVMIYQFNDSGSLEHKYKFSSIDISDVLDFDFTNRRIFVATRKGEMRIYSF